jgi:hypothetical protein
MTTLRRREQCLRNRAKKGHFKALRAHRRRNRPLPPSLETPWIKTGLKPCRGRPFGLYRELELERQNGNSG